MIRFSHVNKQYPNGRRALMDVSFDIAPREMVFLTGHSGAGKSTLLRLLALLDRCDSGEIFLAGHSTATLSPKDLPYLRRSMGMVFQTPRYLPDHSVLHNVALPLLIGGMGAKDRDRRARAALDKVGLLDFGDCLPQDLSSGELQRMGIARAVVHRPPVLIADEPTGNLDPALSLQIMKFFKQFNELGMTILVVSHDISLIEQFSCRRMALAEGRLVAQ